ncbi:MAG: 6-hydroxy-D-nicotine oxidase, partial [Burkholderiaceae bacterium]|nr:6-hydroxy-D-nicotine oxidase [Burkholderiaceae bacterium]
MDRRRFIGCSVAAAVAASLPYGRTWATRIAGDVAAVRSGGGATTLATSDLQQLKDSLRGPLLLPGDPGYDVARHVRNQSIDKHPALIIQPGGHSYAGKSTCDGGMQIDLSSMRGVRVDMAARKAWVYGGSLLGELDHEAMSLGLVTTAGTVSHTGVGGLTLGAGFGRLARRFGLALDNVKSVDIVSSDGQLRHASAEENRDLYWAVRGGGGNFGVVTAFEFDLHPMQRQVIGGAMIFPGDRARELLLAYSEISQSAPDDLYVDAIISAPRGGKPGAFMASQARSSSTRATRDLSTRQTRLSRRCANSESRSRTRSGPSITSSCSAAVTRRIHASKAATSSPDSSTRFRRSSSTPLPMDSSRIRIAARRCSS